MSATVQPDNATDASVVWSSSDANIATVNSDGTVTAINVGNVTITATNSADISTEIELTVIPTLAESVVVTPMSYSLKAGESYNLLATVYPETTTDKSLVWTSSNPDVVTVDEAGGISAIKVGTATITAAAQDGSEVSGICEITVVPTPAEGIAIEYDGKKELYVGDKIALTATVTPDDATDKNVTWQSQSDEVLKVDSNGNVTAVGLGEAWISATNSAGQSEYIVFNVIPTPVSSITLSHTSVELKAGNTVTIAAAVLPEDATNKNLVFLQILPQLQRLITMVWLRPFLLVKPLLL